MNKPLKDASITDSLPAVVGELPQVRALSYAIRQQIRHVLSAADAAITYASVATLSEQVLDILAVDLKLSRYRQDYDIATKRSLVIRALIYWAKAGTKMATERFVGDIFGEGRVVEWFEYDGHPGCFMVEIEDPSIPDERMEDFVDTIKATKRLSAWLDRIQAVIRSEPQKIYVGFAVEDMTYNAYRQKRDGSLFAGFAVHTGDFLNYTMERGN